MHPASTLATPPIYQRHRPERTVLYSIISEHYPRFVQEIEGSGGHLPQFVRQEFEEYLKCGLLDTLSRRIVRVLERRGLLIADAVDPYLELELGSSLNQIQAASINYRIAIDPHAGRAARPSPCTARHPWKRS